MPRPRPWKHWKLIFYWRWVTLPPMQIGILK
jgi:hypothetical protein